MEEEGKVSIDGIDIIDTEIAHLRGHIKLYEESLACCKYAMEKFINVKRKIEGA